MRTIELDDTTIAYEEGGPADGVPVLLSHSLFFDHRMFDPLAALLQEAGFRTIAYDQRGHGQTPGAPRERLTMNARTADAAALLRGLDLAPAHVVGNSMGGFVGLRLAARHPELVRTVAALGSSAEEEHQLEAFAPLVERLGEEGAAPAIDVLLHIMFGDTSLASRPDLVGPWRERMAALSPAIADSALEVIHRAPVVEELAGCAVPVLAISGAEDHAYPPPLSDERLADAAGGRWVRVDGAGHSVALEQPEACAAALLEHFARHAVSA
jgi:3-oxoadipate enol-lactonase